MIDGSDIVVMNKCTEIWALYDEMQDELKMTMTRAWQMNDDYGQLNWNLEKTKLTMGIPNWQWELFLRNIENYLY